MVGRSFATNSQNMRPEEANILVNETVRCPNPIFQSLFSANPFSFMTTKKGVLISPFDFNGNVFRPLQAYNFPSPLLLCEFFENNRKVPI